MSFFDEYVDLVPIDSSRKIGHLTQEQAPRASVFLSLRALYLIFLVIPAALAAFYYFVLAADRYEVEAKFAVRRPSASGLGALGDLLQSTGVVRASDEASAVSAYVLSRDAMNVLIQTSELETAMARSGLDPFWGYPRALTSNSREAEFKEYQSLVSIENDQGTGISTLRVQAFDPEDARRLAAALIDAAEGMVNRLNDRAAAEALSAVEAQAAELKTRLDNAQAALLEFRTREQIVDPARQSVTVLETIGILTQQLSETQASIDTLTATAPRSPQINSLRQRVAALQRQIAEERLKLGGGDASMASLLSEYEALVIEREFAKKAYSTALTGVEVTKVDNSKQRVFIDRVVEPLTPDSPSAPRRFLWVFVILVSGFIFARVAYAIGRNT